MQIILGSGGIIGIELAKALRTYTDNIRLVSRQPQKVNDSDQLFPADLLNSEAVNAAVKGASIVYLTAGLPYNSKTWEAQWPVVMQHVIDACLHNNSKLVFFDNIYLYAPDNLNPVTENSPVNPTTKKGKVRANIVSMIENAAREKGLKALIARCSDFYGPGIKQNSLLAETVIKPLSKGQTANLLCSDNFKHSCTYTPDAAMATALLGNTPGAYGETWHLPTAKNPPTGKEWVEMIARELNVKPKYRKVSKTMVKLMGLFIPVMKESVEMLYQYDRDYVFDSTKFENRFQIFPTPYATGIHETIHRDFAEKLI